MPGGDLDHPAAGRQAGPQTSGPHVAVDPPDRPVAIDPDQVDREPHPDRVDGPRADPQAVVRLQPAPAEQPPPSLAPGSRSFDPPTVIDDDGPPGPVRRRCGYVLAGGPRRHDPTSSPSRTKGWLLPSRRPGPVSTLGLAAEQLLPSRHHDPTSTPSRADGQLLPSRRRTRLEPGPRGPVPSHRHDPATVGASDPPMRAIDSEPTRLRHRPPELGQFSEILPVIGQKIASWSPIRHYFRL